MRVGTKSLLFGVHNVLWHPLTVYLAWCHLYGLPNLPTCVSMFVHDWGYWGCQNMDGAEGVLHPELGAKLARHLGAKYEQLCLFHSRTYAKKYKCQPSRLCWADKLCICYDPAWFYLARARLSGELREYRKEAASSGICPMCASNKEWLHSMRIYMKQDVQAHYKQEVD